MRFVLSMPVLLLSCALAFASGAPTPGGPAAESGQPRETEQQPVEKVPARAIGVAEHFVMPSGNIGCTYIPEGGTDVYEPVDGGPELSCDRIEPKYLRATLGRLIRAGAARRWCCLMSATRGAAALTGLFPMVKPGRRGRSPAIRSARASPASATMATPFS